MISAIFFFFISFGLVAFGQPAWFPWLSPLSAALGYALFWNALLELPFRRFSKVCTAVVWYTAVQLIQLSWMTSTEYHGFYILAVYAFLALWLGVQFGVVTFFLTSKEPLFVASHWGARWSLDNL